MSDKIMYIAKTLLEMGEDFVVAKVVSTQGSTPRKKGAWLLMKANGQRYGTVGGGKLEAESERLALEAFKTKKSETYHFGLKPEEQNGIDMRCGGDADIQIQYIDASHPELFTEEFNANSTAYIFGAGHVALAVEPLLRYVNFNTVVIDERSEYANKERYPEALEIHVIDSFKHIYDGYDVDEDSYVIIVTRGHAGDYEVLKQTLKKNPKYIGMIGSKGKVAENFRKLREEGFSEDDINRVYSPIGLSIFAETPEEIGISIVAEMIKVRAGHGK